jgi:ketopantoate reductase
MNITVIGAGAIGGHIAAKLAAAGETVKVVGSSSRRTARKSSRASKRRIASRTPAGRT